MRPEPGIGTESWREKIQRKARRQLPERPNEDQGLKALPLAKTLRLAKGKHTLLINIVGGTFIILVYIKIHLIKIVNLRKH